jgi:hypothetical protein
MSWKQPGPKLGRRAIDGDGDGGGGGYSPSLLRFLANHLKITQVVTAQDHLKLHPYE